MGVHASHPGPCTYLGAFSKFHRLRTTLARNAGIPIGLMEGYYDKEHLNTLLGALPWGTKSFVERMHQDAPLKWAPWSADALCGLLRASDAGGTIEGAELQRSVAARVEFLCHGLEDESLHQVARDVVAGLREAADLGEVYELS